MGLIQERDGYLRVAGPGSLVQGSVMILALLLLIASVAVPLHEGKTSFSDVPPVILFLGFFLFTMVSFDSNYLIDLRRREILLQTKILRLCNWTRKVAEFADIRGYFLTQPTSTTTRSAMLEVLLSSGRILELRLGSDLSDKIEGNVQELLQRHHLQPSSAPNCRTIWDAPDSHTGCLVSFFGCISPFALVIILGLVECFLPGVYLGVSPMILGLLFSLILLGPFCQSGWRAVPAENLLQRYFRLSRWTFRKTQTLDDFQPEVQRLPEPEPRRYALVLRPGVQLDQFVSEAQAQEALEQFRQQQP